MQGIIAASHLRASSSGGSVTVNYTPSSALIANPERGFYQHEETHSGSYESLDSTDLAAYRTGSDKITQILRLFYLENYRGTAIDSGYLDNMVADFESLRAAKIKAIVRFAYSDGDTVGDYEAVKAKILSHIEQVAPILETYKDVIVAIQAGFIGKYGEWYYSTYFGNAGVVGGGEYDDRKEVVDYMLSKFPVEIPIQVRTPDIKKRITGSSVALTQPEAYQNNSKSRLGHHNDAFLSDEENKGTYINVPVDRAFVATESQYVPVGGETNTANTPYTPCSNALSELEELGYSYLNIDYEPDVIAQWNTEGCLVDIRKKLGYRFLLIDALFPTTASTTMNFQLNINNEGFARPFRERQAFIVFRNTTTNDEFHVMFQSDWREWSFSENINMGIDISSVPPGEYEILLSLPDMINNSVPEYSVQMANTGLWEPSTGFNKLNHKVTIT